ncbi:MAG: YdcF family protein, partial [Candidatus Roizmanbacteria bacterium]
MHLHQPLKHTDIIIALGSSDISVAEHAAKVFLDGYAPRILFSGGFGKITKDLWHTTESEKFAHVAIEMGVPEEAITLENKSSNTGENIQFSRKLLQDNGYDITTAIIACKPYKERRDYATFKKQWPEIEIMVTSSDISYENYMQTIFSRDTAINLLVGDLQRIKIYEELGYQIHQDVPDDVWQAYEKLVQIGFDKYVEK